MLCVGCVCCVCGGVSEGVSEFVWVGGWSVWMYGCMISSIL